MMANAIRKLIKNESSLRLFTSISRNHLPKPAPSPIFSLTNYPVEEKKLDPIFNPVIGENLKDGKLSRFYPSFPFGYCFNPVSWKIDEVESDDAGTIYADSVKKKRKKKMNKHKYRKLRKRLRRKT